MSKVKVIVCEIDKPAVVEEVESPWVRTKELIGDTSYVEVARLQDGVQIYCDEDGVLKKLPVNRLIPAQAIEVKDEAFVIKMHPDLADPGEWGVHVLRGNFLLSRYNDTKDEPLSLTDDDIKKYLWVLAGAPPCRRCGKPRAYPGAVYCGAACSAQAEAHE